MKVGDKLYCVLTRTGGREVPCYVVVEKVGRKWGSLDNRHRVDLETMELDGQGYVSPGKCYTSQTAYETERDLKATWSVLQRWIGDKWMPPKGVTPGAIKQAAKLLGLGLMP